MQISQVMMSCTQFCSYDKQGYLSQFLSYFFVKKIPLSRRVEYVMDVSMDESVSESVSERCMYVTPIRLDLL